jgi:hypothetical protein
MSASAAGTAALIKDLLANNFRVYRSDTLRRNWRYYEASELDKIAESQQAAGVLKIVVQRNEEGKPDMLYIMNPKIQAHYERNNPKSQ